MTEVDLAVGYRPGATDTWRKFCFKGTETPAFRYVGVF